MPTIDGANNTEGMWYVRYQYVCRTFSWDISGAINEAKTGGLVSYLTMISSVVHPMGYWLENTRTFLWASCIGCAPGIICWFIENLNQFYGGSGDRTWNLRIWMTFWNWVLGFGPGIRFFLLRLDLKYHVLGLLEKSMIVYVCSFSITTWQSALQRMARTGHVG